MQPKRFGFDVEPRGRSSFEGRFPNRDDNRSGGSKQTSPKRENFWNQWWNGASLGQVPDPLPEAPESPLFLGVWTASWTWLFHIFRGLARGVSRRVRLKVA